MNFNLVEAHFIYELCDVPLMSIYALTI